jgi:hypothetical protein
MITAAKEIIIDIMDIVIANIVFELKFLQR